MFILYNKSQFSILIQQVESWDPAFKLPMLAKVDVVKMPLNVERDLL